MIDRTLAKVAVGIVLLMATVVLCVGCGSCEAAPVPGPTTRPAVLLPVDGCKGSCTAPR